MDIEEKGGDYFSIKVFFILILIFSIIIIPSIRANVFDVLRDGFDSVTGKAVTSSATDVSITIGNNRPNITNVSITSSWSIVNDPTSNKSVFFSFTVFDEEGTSNINTTSATANFTNGTNGGIVRWNNSAVNPLDGGCLSEGAMGGYQINFSCSVRMMYYDTATTWNVSVFVKDNNDNTAQNDSVTFSLAETTSFSLADSSITFSSASPGTTNVTQSDGGIFMNNTGNDNINSSSINITAVNIHGDTDVTKFIPAANFTISTSSDADKVQCGLSTAFMLGNKSISETTGTNSTLISGASLPTGAAPHNQETLYLCLLHIPNDLTSQIYSTNAEEDWSIIIN